MLLARVNLKFLLKSPRLSCMLKKYFFRFTVHMHKANWALHQNTTIENKPVSSDTLQSLVKTDTSSQMCVGVNKMLIAIAPSQEKNIR